MHSTIVLETPVIEGSAVEAAAGCDSSSKDVISSKDAFVRLFHAVAVKQLVLLIQASAVWLTQLTHSVVHPLPSSPPRHWQAWRQQLGLKIGILLYAHIQCGHACQGERAVSPLCRPIYQLPLMLADLGQRGEAEGGKGG